MVWTVYEMPSFWRELGILRPFLGCQLDALVSAYSGERCASRTRVESAYLFRAIHIAVCSFTTTAEMEKTYVPLTETSLLLKSTRLYFSPSSNTGAQQNVTDGMRSLREHSIGVHK